MREFSDLLFSNAYIWVVLASSRRQHHTTVETPCEATNLLAPHYVCVEQVAGEKLEVGVVPLHLVGRPLVTGGCK
jgi:hypothetical protein